jgi:acyl dehydratase
VADQALSHGPYYDDFARGLEFPVPAAVTLDAGLAAQYLAISGDGLVLCLDRELCREVTGSSSALVNPALVMHMSIGASTVATRKVLANLFYRGVVFRRPVFQGETLHTATRVAALSDARPRPDVVARGKALLAITTTSAGEVVVDYQRCALLPCRGDQPPGHSDDVGVADTEFVLDDFAASVPGQWNLEPLGPTDEWAVREVRIDPLRDVVDQATALVRLTHNLAAVHRDASASPYGKRLVYGGHTVALAQASLVRTLSGFATVLGWLSCDHVAPVFEGDLLACAHTLISKHPVANGLVRQLRTQVFAHRPDGDPTLVLDWRPVVLTT